MKRIARAITTGWVAGLVVVASGCGVAPQPADAAKAQQALHATLEAWKAGDRPADLARLSPPIHARDVDWSAGFRLLDYKADTDGKLVGYDMNYPVVLELKGPRGASVKKSAVYTVTTRPELMVSRQEG